MSDDPFPSFYDDRRRQVNDALDRWLPAEDQPPELLNRSMRYSVLNGGKRLRGVLVLEAGALGKENTEALGAVASALEMIHAYSLVHDDLPAMDDDDWRRGKPSNHVEFGEDIAILTGDGLLTRALEVLGGISELGVTAERSLRVIRTVTRKAGGQGLIGGQVRDLRANSELDGSEDLEKIHQWKTGALMSLSLEVGGLLGELKSDQVEALARFGEQLGLAFQIKDDLLEREGDQETLGKDPNSDEDGDKLTYPSLLGAEGAREALEETIGRARRILDPLDGVKRLDQLVDLVADRTH